MTKLSRVVVTTALGLVMSAAWGQSGGICTLSYSDQRFDSAEAAFASFEQEYGLPAGFPGEAAVCKGAYVSAKASLGPPFVTADRMTAYRIIREDVRAICSFNQTTGKVEYVGPRPPDIYEVAAAITCLSKDQLTLTGLSEVYPAGTGGTSAIEVVARVANGTSRKPGVVLAFAVDAIAKSGGHDHHDPSRPRGSLSVVQGTTDVNGEVKVTFTASEIAGTHTVKATCTTCSNTVVTKEIQVKVPDLLPISPNPPQNADGTFVYALTSVDKTHQGNGRYHLNQYFLTEQAQINLQSMIAAFAAEGWGTVALNDASLFWGGRYDITSNWNAPHAGHREGREIDVSFARAGYPISASKQKTFYDKFCKKTKVSFPFSILHHYVKTPHFHVYLEKQTTCWKSEK